jgi:hypothetical protein
MNALADDLGDQAKWYNRVLGTGVSGQRPAEPSS